MATEAQIRANRENSLRSTGPVSEEGKRASSRNALTHGLTARSEVLTEEDAAFVAEKEAAYRASFQPADDREERLVREMADDAIRIDRAWALYLTLVQRHADRAASCWDLDRRAEAEDLAARLPRDPARVSRALRTTRHGCALMIERWEALGGMVEEGWGDAQRSMALDLLGVHPDLRSAVTAVDEPDGSDPRPRRASLVAAELSRLRALKFERLDAWDDAERALAEQGIGAELSRPLRLLHRYETTLKGRWHAAHRYFQARDGHRPQAAPAPAATATASAARPKSSEPVSIGPRLTAALRERPAEASAGVVETPTDSLPEPAPASDRPLTKRQRRLLSRRQREQQRRSA